RALLPSLSRIPSGFPTLHSGWVAAVGWPAHGGVARLAYRAYGHASGVCYRVCEALAALAPGKHRRVRHAGLAAVSAPLSRSHSAAFATSGTDRQPLLRMAA